ncbi:MAG TPA: CheR family methyltransferase [Opitutaceae bacterium]|jgi:chemotaxis protein methyltransferase CheR
MISPAIAPPLVETRDPVAQLLRDLVHDKTGAFFETDRLGSLMEKLQPLAGSYGCRTFLDYYYVLKYDDPNGIQLKRLLDAISVQETFFWRESDQLRALTDRVAPAWFKQTSKPLRIWSAACASGEEPYSIAIALREAGLSSHPIEILGSDASEAALAAARTAVYRERSFRTLSHALREKYFHKVEGGHRLTHDIVSKVQFRWANLMKLEDLTESAGAQVVFCRNVFIYFSPTSIQKVLSHMSNILPRGGYLFTGASESLFNVTRHFELNDLGGAFVYMRNSRP